MTQDELINCDLSQQLFSRATEYGMARWSQRFVSGMRDIARAMCRFESPLEFGFFVWWYAYIDSRGLEELLSMRGQVDIEANCRPYRLDFAIYPIDWPEIGASCDQHGLTATLIAVELDGHEFHERTRDQVIARDKRDRDLLASGWRVLHYSGSEFVKDPEVVLEEVCRTAVRTYMDLREQITKLDGRAIGGGADIAR